MKVVFYELHLPKHITGNSHFITISWHQQTDWHIHCPSKSCVVIFSIRIFSDMQDSRVQHCAYNEQIHLLLFWKIFRH